MHSQIISFKKSCTKKQSHINTHMYSFVLTKLHSDAHTYTNTHIHTHTHTHTHTNILDTLINHTNINSKSCQAYEQTQTNTKQTQNWRNTQYTQIKHIRKTSSHNVHTKVYTSIEDRYLKTLYILHSYLDLKLLKASKKPVGNLEIGHRSYFVSKGK